MAEELGQSPTNIELKAIVAEASRALAALDALRLEEMALSCEVLNRMAVKRWRGRRVRPPRTWKYLAGCWRRQAPTCA